MCAKSTSDIIDFSLAEIYGPQKIWVTAIMVAMLPTMEKHFLGITEEDILMAMEKIGIKKEDTLKIICYLIEKDLVEHKLSQEGTAGPFDHRYRVNLEKVNISFFPPPPEIAPKA